MTEFLAALIKVSEKAANIARVCRQDRHLFTLLVQEKKSADKNARFVQDFKTLADVLIQETVKHDIGRQFPEIASNIKGEESNTFINTLGNSINVEIMENEASTAAHLSQVLNGDMLAAKLLAAEVHKSVSIETVNVPPREIPKSFKLPLDQLGMWIDPIDSTAEYISGDEVKATVQNIHRSGLNCVTVLVGVFDRKTGEPVLGVVNQPFYICQEARWHGRCVWGVSYQDLKEYSNGEPHAGPATQKIVVLSTSESPALKAKLAKAGFVPVEAAGAGYKILCVAMGNADAYLLSKGTTFRWDTCAPHALLTAQGGGIVSYSQAVAGRQDQLQQVSYAEDGTVKTRDVGAWCNKEGIIAYRDYQVLLDLVKVLQGT